MWSSKHFPSTLSHFPQTSLSGSLNWLLFQRHLKDASVLSFVNSKWTCIRVSDQMKGSSLVFYFLESKSLVIFFLCNSCLLPNPSTQTISTGKKKKKQQYTQIITFPNQMLEENSERLLNNYIKQVLLINWNRQYTLVHRYLKRCTKVCHLFLLDDIY